MLVTIAPLIRTKLRSITARESSHPSSHDPRWMKTMAELLTSGTIPCLFRVFLGFGLRFVV